ncbi:RBR-type E3 ubiquitin transferase [Trichophyton interdigitale]|nr:RBR-type E3 ubiquitin transferase [Trichophyton interdigitale]KAG5216736.1 RBR-type E3 ubiquitin transferase [Trichophyton interdigitale]KAG8205263.1 RBR-type E3 ubiquitin transferase [Trichophyton interdigitale]
MEQANTPATTDKRRHFHHHHNRRRIHGEPIEQVEGDGAAEPERRPKKEKRVSRSSLLVHTGHRNHRYYADAGASRSGGSTSHPAQNTKQSLGRSDSHPLNARASTRVRPLPGEKKRMHSNKIPGQRPTASAVNDDRRSSPSPLLIRIFNPEIVLRAERQVTCVICMSDDIPASKTAKLACAHRICHGCLRRAFTLSITDPQHMPPRCCTSDHIPLKHVENLFDLKFKLKWNQKFREYTTKNRKYCPSKGCGKWIPPANIYRVTGSRGTSRRRYGVCSRCKTMVCCTCGRKWHKDEDCPQDEGSIEFAEIAKQEGWRRCYNCSAMVELKEGCNHITCRCTAQFCIVCGLKWKTCDCPWFNYADIPDNVPPGAADDIRDPVCYQEEIDRRREQEADDEALAIQLQYALALGIDPDLDSS